MVAVLHIMALGQAAFNRNEEVLSSKQVYLKAKIFHTYILTVMLYDLDCANSTSKLLQKLATFQQHLRRLVLNNRLSNHIFINDLLNITKFQPITSAIKLRVLKQYSHMKRSTHVVSYTQKESQNQRSTAKTLA